MCLFLRLGVIIYLLYICVYKKHLPQRRLYQEVCGHTRSYSKHLQKRKTTVRSRAYPKYFRILHHILIFIILPVQTCSLGCYQCSQKFLSELYRHVLTLQYPSNIKKSKRPYRPVFTNNFFRTSCRKKNVYIS